ncbi:MAG: YigZ family protein [Bacteroidia bacterium]
MQPSLFCPDMFDLTYKSIAQPSTGVYRDKGSKFLAFAYPVKSETEIKSILQQLKKEHPKANHHCFAYRLGAYKNIFRHSDDREPSGSAGRPIYGVILANDLTQILIVVVRYFGGTLLGVPGLIQAYKGAADDAIQQASVQEFEIEEYYNLVFRYELLNDVMRLLKQSHATILQQQMSDDCSIDISVSKKNADNFINGISQNYLLKEGVTLKVKS